MQKEYGDFLSQFHESLQKRSAFVKACSDNELSITEARLSLYEQEDLIRPIAIDEYETFYSPFQLFRIYVIERYVNESLKRTKIIRNENGALVQKTPFEIKSVLDHNRENILHQNEEFYRVISLLHHLEPFYCSSFTITTHLEHLGFQRHSHWLQEKRHSGIAKETMASHGLETEALRRWQWRFSSTALDIDPLAAWYHFLQNIGSRNIQKTQRLKGSASLAQVFYRMEKILRGAIEDATNEKILNPHDIRDLSGGSWRIARDEKGEEVPCTKCGAIPVKIQTLDTRQQEKIMCQNCMKIFFKDMDESQKSGAAEKIAYPNDAVDKKTTQNILAETPLVCNKCKKILIKSLNEGLLLDMTPFCLLAAELEYGEMLLRVKCKKCGEVVMRSISIGWDASSES